jgi:hypothetical protein
MDEWTREQVEERLVEAADVLKRLPKVRVQGYFSLWPQIAYEFSDLVGQQPAHMRRPPPSPQAISHMEETLDWTKGLDTTDAKVVWARAERTPWKAICWRFGMSRATAYRRWEYGLCFITWRLNGRRPSAKLSRRVLISRARAVSSR